MNGVLTEEEKLAIVSNNGLDIFKFDDPSLPIQLVAVRQNHLSLKFISTPHEEVLFEIARLNPRLIKYAPVLSDSIQVSLVMENPATLRWIKEPCLRAKFLAACIKN